MDDKVLMNVRVKRSVLDEFKSIAERMEVPYSQLVRAALRDFLEGINTGKKENRNDQQ